MPRNRCRPVLALAGLLALAALAALQPAPAQPPQPPGSVPLTAAVSVPGDAQRARRVEAVEDRVQEKAWEEIGRLVQSLLDRPDDAFVAVKRRGTDGKETVRWLSVRGEADRILRSLPKEGRE